MAPVKPVVTKDVLDQLDVRVGTIRAAEEVPASQKLVRLRVTFGDHERQILAGLKTERPDLQALVGRQTLFVVNLQPRRMAGEMSREACRLNLGQA